MELYFGWRTAVLFCAVVVTMPIAAALLQAATNVTANRTLALMLLVLVGVMMPWMIGFAGFYDQWPWLTFLPVALPLLVPPLAFLYAYSLMHAGWPPRAWLALLPGVSHFALMLVAFCLPSAAKQAVAEAAGAWMGAFVAFGLLTGFPAALFLIIRAFNDYSRWLGNERSDDARFATRWLARAIAALGLLFALWAGFVLVDLIYPLGYEELMPLYCGIAAATVFLSVEGWRHATLPWPVMPCDPITESLPASAGRDWVTLGEHWRAELQASGAYRESDLTLARAARLLGTNTSYLSRACNEGLGVNFSTLVNRMRAEAVAQAIADAPADGMLHLALEAGFASKASFNRAFLERFATTPSAFRRGLRLSKSRGVDGVEATAI